ncbi:hypothetical protein [Couchioplanes azureus]|uniref:hypothetical protein n=1 Tax=Couchioplanes caeruleus TaxID=56438 RepID=UPI0016706D00|nr:hypothetical protein [Couchioplanes caeruleus]GGQ53825.1 hypothetical protein GCM10010166_23270 [Couchioplanes caeruleus subsp. azureus]
MIVIRQRELASRHEVLGREGRDPGRYEDLLLRVFDATNDLVRDLDRLRARSARRRRVVAAGLVLVALVVAGLVAAGAVPVYGLIGAAVALVLAGTLAVVARATAPSDSPAAAEPAPQAPSGEPPTVKAPAGNEPVPAGAPRGSDGLPRPRRQDAALARPGTLQRTGAGASRKAGA